MTTSSVLDRLADDLVSVAGTQRSRAEIEQVLHGSLRDLAGSVSLGSMPEMLARLACVRMGIRLGTVEAEDPAAGGPGAHHDSAVDRKR
jgi:hypothetical protein